MSHKIKTITKRNRSQATRLALLASIALCVDGCSIPKLRGPQAGPVLPSSYQAGTNWNRGEMPVPATQPPVQSSSASAAGTNPAGGNTAPDQPDSKSSDAPPQSNDPAGEEQSEAKDKAEGKTSRKWFPSIKLVSFVKPGSALKIADEQTSKTTKDGLEVSESPANQANQAGGAQPDNSSWNVSPSDNSSTISKPLGKDPISEELEGQTLNPVLLTGGGWQAEPAGSPSSAVMSRYDMFNDPTLNSLIQQAITGNQELKILAEDVQIACYEVQARAVVPIVLLLDT